MNANFGSAEQGRCGPASHLGIVRNTLPSAKSTTRLGHRERRHLDCRGRARERIPARCLLDRECRVGRAFVAVAEKI